MLWYTYSPVQVYKIRASIICGIFPHRKSKEAGVMAPSPEEAPCGDFDATYRFCSSYCVRASTDDVDGPQCAIICPIKIIYDLLNIVKLLNLPKVESFDYYHLHPDPRMFTSRLYTPSE